MNQQNSLMQPLSDSEVNETYGAGLFYELGAFFADVANAHDAIYRTYGNTNRNHW
ncbi:hypothetical protein [Alteromonas lipotrueiana]|uniref:hypothetical protein n=1 Tax=Alteromonas lipotrueiana TaxID=2803815 RepID=UPI001C484835|nr:hypothetical protein [Alteromonas lipotrueiana]